MFHCEKLDAWRRSIEPADLVHRVTRSFPDNERFGLTNRLRRAAASISSNLAEGCLRSSKVDFARVVELAMGSAFEAASPSVIAQRQGCLTIAEFASIQNSTLEITRMLRGLRRPLLRQTNGPRRAAKLPSTFNLQLL